MVLHCIVLYDSQGCVNFFTIKYCFPNSHLIILLVVVFAHCGGGVLRFHHSVSEHVYYCDKDDCDKDDLVNFNK